MELAEQIAMRFHFWYESLAPKYDYATRKESHVEWDQVPENNRSLMVAVARQVADEFAICETEEAVDTTPNTVSTQCPHWELDEPDEGEITHCCYHPDKLLWARRT